MFGLSVLVASALWGGAYMGKGAEEGDDSGPKPKAEVIRAAWRGSETSVGIPDDGENVNARQSAYRIGYRGVSRGYEQTEAIYLKPGNEQTETNTIANQLY